MRLVVDTNVFVSAALKEVSWPAWTVRWLGRHGGLLKTSATEEEVLAVLQRPRIAPKIAPSFYNSSLTVSSTPAHFRRRLID